MQTPSQAKKHLIQYEKRQRRRLTSPAPHQAQYLDRTTTSLLLLGLSKNEQLAALKARVRPTTTTETSEPSEPKATQQDIPGFNVQSSPKPKVKKYDGHRYPAAPQARGTTVTTRKQATPIDLPLLADPAELGTLPEFEPDQTANLITRLQVLKKNCSRYRYQENARNKGDERKHSLPAINPKSLERGRSIELALLNRDAGLLFCWDSLCQSLLLCQNDRMFRLVSTECGEWLAKIGTSLSTKNETGLL